MSTRLEKAERAIEKERASVLRLERLLEDSRNKVPCKLESPPLNSLSF